MGKITRRSMLASIPAVGMAPIVPAMAEPVQAPVITPRQRLNAAIDELKAAVAEMDPNVERWDIGWSEDDSLSISFSAMAFRRTGQYEGDGTYESGTSNVWDRRGQYQVRLLDRRIDGHRTFEVCDAMDRWVLLEPRLNTLIGRRVA